MFLIVSIHGKSSAQQANTEETTDITTHVHLHTKYTLYIIYIYIYLYIYIYI